MAFGMVGGVVPNTALAARCQLMLNPYAATCALTRACDVPKSDRLQTCATRRQKHNRKLVDIGR